VCGLLYQACCAFNIELLCLLASSRPTTTTTTIPPSSHKIWAQLSEARSEPFKMQGQIDELKSQLDAARDLLHRAEADADLQRRERDRLKGQLLESKAQLASLRQQVRDMSALGERVKASCTRLGVGVREGNGRDCRCVV
jgi:chromosome segregation ATPase